MPRPTTNPISPAELKTLRAHLGLSQQQLAERIGVQRNTVNRWEMGDRKISVMVSRLLRGLKIINEEKS
jgi:DNA-binding transcriptional regulator YiaG